MVTAPHKNGKVVCKRIKMQISSGHGSTVRWILDRMGPYVAYGSNVRFWVVSDVTWNSIILSSPSKVLKSILCGNRCHVRPYIVWGRPLRAPQV